MSRPIVLGVTDMVSDNVANFLRLRIAKILYGKVEVVLADEFAEIDEGVAHSTE